MDDLALSIYPPVCPLTVRINVSTGFEGIAADLIGRISVITGISLNCGEYVYLLHLDVMGVFSLSLFFSLIILLHFTGSLHAV